jgi:hypothetical protein
MSFFDVAKTRYVELASRFVGGCTKKSRRHLAFSLAVMCLGAVSGIAQESDLQAEQRSAA